MLRCVMQRKIFMGVQCVRISRKNISEGATNKDAPLTVEKFQNILQKELEASRVKIDEDARRLLNEVEESRHKNSFGYHFFNVMLAFMIMAGIAIAGGEIYKFTSSKYHKYMEKE